MTQKFPAAGELFEQRYELLEELGSGGVSTVFKARQIDADRLIALKVLHPHKIIDQEFKQRFLREAQALNKLSHCNIVTVYHLGLSEGTLPYLAMELIDGVSLRKVLDDAGRLPAYRVFKIMKQLCGALSCMHESGIIHRDLKPANIMLLQKPEPDAVKIIDFGLVKVDTGSDQKLTATGLLIGSVNYMSPEQCLGKKADSRSDTYALAICMYEMLDGKPPFTSDNPVGLMYKHVNQQPPEFRLQNGKPIHPSIREFIFKGLQKDPALRFQTAAEMDEALTKLAEHFRGEIGPGAASSRALAQQQLSIAFMLLCCAVLLSALFVLAHSHSQVPVQVVSGDVFNAASFCRNERENKRLLAIGEKAIGPNHLQVARSICDFANCDIQQGKYADAEKLYMRALAILEKALGPNNPDVVGPLGGLANCYRLQGKYAEAESLYKRALAILEKAVGPSNPDVVDLLGGIAVCYLHQGNYAEAELLYKRSLAIVEKARGQEHHYVAANLCNLASCYDAQGRCAEAEPLYKRALAIDEKVFGPNDPWVAVSLNYLANCYCHQGKYTEAEPLFKRSLEIWEMWPSNPNVAIVLSDYAKLLRATKRETEAVKLEARSKTSLLPDTQRGRTRDESKPLP